VVRVVVPVVTVNAASAATITLTVVVPVPACAYASAAVRSSTTANSKVFFIRSPSKWSQVALMVKVNVAE
jgi:hypothetical protein